MKIQISDIKPRIGSARVAVVTGASSGIGLETAKALAAAGWRVLGVGRDPERSAAALAEIRAGAEEDGKVEMLRADLALITDTAELATDIAARTDRIDVLLNNAGGTPRERVVTAEGNEATFAGNHLGHFLLTNRVMPLLRAAAAVEPRGAVRIINTASSAHEYSSGLDWGDLQMLNDFVTNKAYCNAKLATVLFTRALAKRAAPYGIVVHAAHPGLVATRFASRGDDSMQQYFAANVDKLMSAKEGADTLIWLATAGEPGETTGGYFFQRAPGTVSALGRDDAAAERLWIESEALVAGY
jgi:NAD(P)-dependent dehydrogenase (short-subunit alcohol dehydrogenase family)